jgi:hypothetical protein
MVRIGGRSGRRGCTAFVGGMIGPGRMPGRLVAIISGILRMVRRLASPGLDIVLVGRIYVVCLVHGCVHA